MLTAKQEKFVQGVIEGKSQADAYRAAYAAKRMSDKQIWEEASKLAAKPKVAQRIAELRDKIASDCIMSAKERLKWLTTVVNDPDVDINARLKASDQMNKMQGEYVQKIEADVKSEVTINVELVDDE